ncbi:MAG: polysaccharide biosynthesis tyrosine autokinase [Bacteroidales bacterium]|nr:polysaccharide biosynthesis tyrosine autokinase [Bacteroidales bacterium]
MNETNNNYPSRNLQDPEDNQIKIIDIWHMVWDHIWWYVAAVVLCVIVAAFYLYRTPPTYNRTAKVIIDESAQNSAIRDVAAFTTSRMISRSSDNVYNEVQAFSSPDLMEKVIIRLGLETAYTEIQKLREVALDPSNTPVEMALVSSDTKSGFSFKFHKTGPSTFYLDEFKLGKEDLKNVNVKGCLGDTLQTPVGVLAFFPTLHIGNWNNDMRISWASAHFRAKGYTSALNVAVPDKQTSVIALTMGGRYPSRLEEILTTLIDVYNGEWINAKNLSARNTSAFINERLVIIEEELREIENELKNYKERNNLTDVKNESQLYFAESNEYARKSFELSNKISCAKFIKAYLADPAHSQDLIPANSGISSTSVESQIAEYNKLLINRDQLKAGSGETNPIVADCNQSLASMKVAIVRSVDNLITTLEMEAGLVEDKEKGLLESIAGATDQEFQLLSIERQQKVKESLYIYLLQKREENEIASLVNVANTRLIMAPNGSSTPVAPRRMVILLAAILIGLCLPFAYFYIIKVIDTKVRLKSDLDVLTIPFLAEVPERKKKNKRQLRRILKGKEEEKREIVVKGGKRNAINEAYRVLRTNTDMMLGNVEGPKTIMMTSFNPGSGKTFTTMNMAQSMAIKGSKVIMMDLDLRKASLSKSLCEASEGVAQYLAGASESYGIINISENLDLIPVGNIPPNPSELLLTDKFGAMMEELKNQYEYIFLDCPPVEIVADASIITKFADLSIFVIRSGLMDKRALPIVESNYRENKYNHMAVILNGVTNDAGKYGTYSYGYGYGYGYGHGYGYGYGYNKESDDED